MALTLSTADQARVGALLTKLLSPAPDATLATWQERTITSFRELLRAQATLSWTEGSGFVCPESTDIQKAWRAEEGGEGGGIFNSSPTAVLEDGARVQRRRGRGAGTVTILDALLDHQLTRSSWYHDVVKPVGVETAAWLFAGNEGGEALVAALWDRWDGYPFGHDDTFALLNLLLPVYQAGIAAVDRFARARATWATIVEQHPDAVVVFDRVSGREIHCNARFTALLAADPEGPRLSAAVGRKAGAVAIRPPKTGGAIPWETVGRLEIVATRARRYQVGLTLLPAGVFTVHDAVLVTVRPLGLVLPSLVELRARHGLTRREAEVALAIMAGSSDAEAAAKLGVSVHTIGHHLESVYAKAGVRSRASLIHTVCASMHE